MLYKKKLHDVKLKEILHVMYTYYKAEKFV